MGISRHLPSGYRVKANCLKRNPRQARQCTVDYDHTIPGLNEASSNVFCLTVDLMFIAELVKTPGLSPERDCPPQVFAGGRPARALSTLTGSQTWIADLEPWVSKACLSLVCRPLTIGLISTDRCLNYKRCCYLSVPIGACRPSASRHSSCPSGSLKISILFKRRLPLRRPEFPSGILKLSIRRSGF